MSIDPNTETIFPLTEANSKAPGRPISRGAWTRRALRGINVNGRVVKLSTIMLGRERYCSEEAMARFFEELNAEPAATAAPESVRSAKSKAASRELEAMGV